MQHVHAASTGGRFESVLVAGATALLALAAVWALLLVLAALLEAVSRGRVPGLAGVGCPRAWRPVLLAVVSAALALPATSATASDRPGERAQDGTGGTWLSVPARVVDLPAQRHGQGPAQAPVSKPAPASKPAPKPEPAPVSKPAPAPVSTPAPRDLVVQPGDSLWRLAEGLLPDRAGDAEVAALAGRLHHANRDLIGADPDLILPGQRLALPDLPDRPDRGDRP